MAGNTDDRISCETALRRRNQLNPDCGISTRETTCFLSQQQQNWEKKKGVTYGVKEAYKTYQLIITHTLYMDSDLNNHPINTHTQPRESHRGRTGILNLISSPSGDGWR